MTGAGLTYGMSLHVYLKDKNGQPISGNACDNCVAGDGTFDVGPFGIPSFLWDNPAPTWAWWTGTDLGVKYIEIADARDPLFLSCPLCVKPLLTCTIEVQ